MRNWARLAILRESAGGLMLRRVSADAANPLGREKEGREEEEEV